MKTLAKILIWIAVVYTAYLNDRQTQMVLLLIIIALKE